MNDAAKPLLDGLRANGYKLTQARRALVHVLANSSRPLPVSELHEQAQRINPQVGLVTVYRTLDILGALNLVRPVHLANNCHAYALASPGHTHHLVCRECHGTVEFAGCDLSLFLQQVAQETGYRITGHWLELEGLCARCQQEAQEPGAIPPDTTLRVAPEEGEHD